MKLFHVCPHILYACLLFARLNLEVSFIALPFSILQSLSLALYKFLIKPFNRVSFFLYFVEQLIASYR